MHQSENSLQFHPRHGIFQINFLNWIFSRFISIFCVSYHSLAMCSNITIMLYTVRNFMAATWQYNTTLMCVIHFRHRIRFSSSLALSRLNMNRSIIQLNWQIRSRLWGSRTAHEIHVDTTFFYDDMLAFYCLTAAATRMFKLYCCGRATVVKVRKATKSLLPI